jgi:hypothetical protein
LQIRNSATTKIVSLRNTTEAQSSGGRAMAAALQINLALWGMIACAAIKIGQMLGVGF